MVTAVGKIPLVRGYRVCRGCDDAGFPADAVLGLGGSVTRRASRLICHVGASDSFERGERTLRELMGWSVDAETVRRLCHAEAAKCRENEAERREVAEKFGKAVGDREVQIDAGKVNTDTGWRDVKVGIFAKRPAGAATTTDGSGVSPAQANSSSSGGKSAEVRFIRSTRLSPATLITYSPAARTLRRVSFSPTLTKPSIGGLWDRTVK